jgi:hypothetical protein
LSSLFGVLAIPINLIREIIGIAEDRRTGLELLGQAEAEETILDLRLPKGFGCSRIKFEATRKRLTIYNTLKQHVLQEREVRCFGHIGELDND